MKQSCYWQLPQQKEKFVNFECGVFVCSSNGHGHSLHEKWSMALIRLSNRQFSILSSCSHIPRMRENENSGLASETWREINEFDSCQIDLSLAKLNFASIFRGNRFWCANLWSFFYFKPERISKTLSILLLTTWLIHKIMYCCLSTGKASAI